MFLNAEFYVNLLQLLLVDKKITNARDLVSILEDAIKGGHPLLFYCLLFVHLVYNSCYVNLLPNLPLLLPFAFHVIINIEGKKMVKNVLIILRAQFFFLPCGFDFRASRLC